jgi:hypothetical protein
MQQQLSDLSAQSPVVTTPSVRLWTPNFIAGVTFFLLFPAGIVLAAINWMRMKMTEKAIIHLFAGAVGTIIFVVAIILTPGTVARLIGLAVNLGVLFYLRWQMEKDINVFRSANRVEAAGWPGGCLIGLGMLILYFLLAFFLSIIFVLVGAPIPD